jgi:hypothetical protein
VHLRREAGLVPAEFVEITLLGDDFDLSFPTGKNGEFYFENAPPGRYRATLGPDGKTCSLEITVPESSEMLVDVGYVVCEADEPVAP